MNAPHCPLCDGPGFYLGALGTLSWFRCIGCGTDFSQPTADLELDDCDIDTEAL